MQTNVGNVDKVIRVVLGLGLLSLVFILEGKLRWVGLAGVVLLATVALGWCPIYGMLGMSSKKKA